MARRPDSAAPSTRHPSQLLALAIGAVYTLVGLLGFFVTGFDNFAAETDETLLGFEVNPLHNIVHLAIGLAGLALWRRLDTARTYGWLLAAGYGLAFVYGLFAAGNSDINFLSINGRRQWPAPGERAGRAGHCPVAGAPDRPRRPRRPWRLTRNPQPPWSATRTLRSSLDEGAG